MRALSVLNRAIKFATVIILMAAFSILKAEPSPNSPDKKLVETATSDDDRKSMYIFSGKKIHFKQEGGSVGNKIWRVFIVFVFLLAISFGLLQLYKKYYGPETSSVGHEPRIKVIDSKRINAKSNVIMLEVDGVQYLLVQTGDRIVKLSEKSLIKT